MGDMIDFLLNTESAIEVWKLHGYDTLFEWEALGDDWADTLL